MKSFKLTAPDIRPLIPDLGFCVATDRITVDGAPVGVLYRDPPQRDGDSGWVCLAGDETQDYLDDPDNLGVYDLNTVANHGPDIIRYLTYPEGTRVERRDGTLDVVAGPAEPPAVRLLPAAQPGHLDLTPIWAAQLSRPMMRRIDEGQLVLWRPGLTAFFAAYAADPDQTPQAQIDAYLERANAEHTGVRRQATADMHSVRYRLCQADGEAAHYALNGLCIASDETLLVALYFDRPELEPEATALFESLAPTGG